jgi:hypothetical protein
MTPRCCACTALLVLAVLVGAAPLSGQQAYRVQRLTGPIQLDGRSDEPAWAAIAPLPVVASSPLFGAAPSEATEFRVAYDDEFLYLAARLYDSDRSGIRGPSLRRDEGGFNNDWFAVNLDTYRDRETAVVFGVSPAGAMTDVVFTGDGAANNFTWNTFWDARVAHDEDGWYAEIRIPFSSLRFEEREGVVLMGMTVWRRIARRNEMISWPAIEHRWGTFSIFKASQMAEIVLEGIYRQNPVFATPYMLAGAARVNRLDAAGGGYLPSDRTARELGLDLKYSPAPNFAIDLTLNTDFAQVEADDQQVNLTRFSLFFPERRLFFQERANLFDFPLGGSDQLFYSRTIGLVGGEPVRIYGGGRAVARIANWDVGVLDMQTAAAATTGSENTGVARLRRRVLNENSHVGALFTSRIGSGSDARSVAAGVDALLRVAGQNYVSVALAATAAAGDSTIGDTRLFARAVLDRRGIYGALYGAEVAHVGAAFAPSLGFVTRAGHARAALRLGYGLRMNQDSRWLRQALVTEASAYRRHANGELETADAAAEWSIEARTGRTFSITGRARHEELSRAFRIADGVAVPAGSYDFATVRLAHGSPPGDNLRVSANVEGGGYYDGMRVSISLTPTWNASKHMQLSGAWQANRIDFSQRNERLTAHVTRVRVQAMLNTRVSGVTLVQYNSTTNTVLLNARVRVNPREGNDLYIVYNHGVNTDRFGYDPVRPITDNSALLVKYSHTLRF